MPLSSFLLTIILEYVARVIRKEKEVKDIPNGFLKKGNSIHS
jgi:hypothetical protein